MPTWSTAVPKSNSSGISPADGNRRRPCNTYLSRPVIDGFMRLSILYAAGAD